jgi:hypothetical protein
MQLPMVMPVGFGITLLFQAIQSSSIGEGATGAISLVGASIQNGMGLMQWLIGACCMRHVWKWSNASFQLK